MMGKTLHNKIQLGRSSVLNSKRFQTAMLLAAVIGISVAWLIVRAAK
jgi:hypothetical protein